MKKIFSFDAETNGLWGQGFVIGALVLDQSGSEVARFVGRCPIEGEVDKWVQENVLPKIKNIPVTHAGYGGLLTDFAKFYLANKGGADVIAHVCVPVEAKVLIDMHSARLIDDSDGPFPLIDVASVLLSKGHDPISVDKYNEYHRLTIGWPEMIGLATHHPLYDSFAAAIAYMHLMQ